jgi:hypothetical protein
MKAEEEQQWSSYGYEGCRCCCVARPGNRAMFPREHFVLNFLYVRECLKCNSGMELTL